MIAAGNAGRPGSIGSPGSADAALTVGAVDRDDLIAWFSSRGPRVGDGGMKPEVTAPGVGIAAAEAGTTGHVAYSGTSMATAHVTGAVALLKQQHPEWKGAQLKAALAGSAKPGPDQTVFDQGLGRIGVAKAVKAQVFADQIVINFGTRLWPHHDDEPVAKDITYVNTSAADVTVDLKIDSNAPAGLFSLSTTKLTVPAKGRTAVTLVGDTRVGTKDAVFDGQVTATAAGQSVRTLVSIDREVESYDMALSYIDRNGGKPGWYVTSIEGLDTDKYLLHYGSGPDKVRLPKGVYTVDVGFEDEAAGSSDIVVHPTIPVHGDTSVTSDARLAKPVSVTSPEPTVDTAGDTPAALPISVVRFAPKLDDNDSLPGGRTHRIDLSVQHQQGAGRIRNIDVEHSFDEGRTRRRTVVLGTGAFLHHPAGPGTVSLRAKATDSRGNTVEQTVIRAYKIA